MTLLKGVITCHILLVLKNHSGSPLSFVHEKLYVTRYGKLTRSWQLS